MISTQKMIKRNSPKINKKTKNKIKKAIKILILRMKNLKNKIKMKKKIKGEVFQNNKWRIFLKQ